MTKGRSILPITAPYAGVPLFVPHWNYAGSCSSYVLSSMSYCSKINAWCDCRYICPGLEAADSAAYIPYVPWQLVCNLPSGPKVSQDSEAHQRGLAADVTGTIGAFPLAAADVFA